MFSSSTATTSTGMLMSISSSVGLVVHWGLRYGSLGSSWEIYLNIICVACSRDRVVGSLLSKLGSVVRLVTTHMCLFSAGSCLCRRCGLSAIFDAHSDVAAGH